MFGWRKRNEGFEWREYVRTTILARRARRRQNLEDARDAAIEGLKEVGRRGAVAGAAGVHAAREGLVEAGRRGAAAGAAGVQAAREGLIEAARRGAAAGASGLEIAWAVLKEAGRRGAIATARAMQWLGRQTIALLRALGRLPGWTARHLGPVLAPAWQALGRRMAPLAELLGQRDVRTVIVVVAAVAAIAFGARLFFGKGFDVETVAALITALFCLVLLALPRLMFGPPIHVPWSWPTLRLPAMPTAGPVFNIAAGVLGVAVVGGAGWLLLQTTPRLAALVGSPLGIGSSAIEGRATALSGDTLLLNGKLIRLAGIEAPDLDQPCSQNGMRRWRCGQAAKDVLVRIVRGGSVTCELGGRDGMGRTTGTCRRGETDLAGEIVRRGYAFADSGLFARYGTLEREARDKRTGIWRSDAVRPSEYRAKRWEEAKRAAPDGCPIKGHVGSDGPVYVLPWSASYDRIKVRATKGERWFCSEAEAQAAGWKPIERS